LRVGWIGFWAKLSWHEMGKRPEYQYHHQGHDSVHHHLPGVKSLGRRSRVHWILARRSSGACFPEEIDVRRNESDEHRRNEKYVRDEKSRNGQSAHFIAAAHQTFEPGANERNICRHIRADCGREISLLIPRQEVSRERHGQHQGEQDAPGNPEKFPAPFVGAVKIRLRKVKKHDDHDRARAVGVQAA
jgi:hypothetical protein